MKKIIVFLISIIIFVGCATQNPTPKPLSKPVKIKKRVFKNEKTVNSLNSNEICAVGEGQNQDIKKAKKIAILVAKARISRMIRININSETDMKMTNDKNVKNKVTFTTKSRQDSLTYLKNLKIVQENYKNGIYFVKICKKDEK